MRCWKEPTSRWKVPTALRRVVLGACKVGGEIADEPVGDLLTACRFLEEAERGQGFPMDFLALEGGDHLLGQMLRGCVGGVVGVLLDFQSPLE
jgi:hypothetical protein